MNITLGGRTDAPRRPSPLEESERGKEGVTIELKLTIGKPVHLKVRNDKMPHACTVRNVEPSGLWVSGPTVLQNVVQSGVKTAERDLVVFFPLQEIEWVVAADQK
jgi:hypothetical protein